MPLERPLQRLPAWNFYLLLGAVALLALAEAFGPRGFAGRDELLVLQDLARRAHGGAVYDPWGNGAILKLLQSWAWRWTGDWRSLHGPVLLAMAAQGLALSWLGHQLGGRTVAQGAVLASLVSATALLSARSLLPFAILPALISVSAALLFKGRWWAFAGAALLACGFLEYEGVLFALPGVAAFFIFEPRLKRGRSWAHVLAGYSLGLLAVLYYCRSGLAEWWAFRLTYAAPLRHLATGDALQQLLHWSVGGRPEAYLGVYGHPVPAAWAMAFIALGLGLQARARPWLWVWSGLPLLALLAASGAFEPQRTVAAFPALALAAGFGWHWAWEKASSRPTLAYGLILLPWLGLAQEQAALDRSLDRGEERYARSQGWMAAARDPQIRGQVDAMLMPAGMAIEGMLGSPQTRPRWVWLAGDLGEDAPPWKGVALYDDQGHLTGDCLALVPGPDPLLDDLAFLRGFWFKLPEGRAAVADACRQALQGPSLKTPVARASVWMSFLQAGLPVGHFGVADLQAFDKEAFKSSHLYRACSAQAQGKDLRLNYWLLWLMRRHCGDKSLTPGERETLAQPWDQVWNSPGSPPWPAPSLP